MANVCTLHNIVLLPQWVPREENVKAEKISKSTNCDDWEIDEDVFTKLNNVCGPHAIDRFASYYNTKYKVFNSNYWCPGTTCINAFDQHWRQENNCIVPPPLVAQKCIQQNETRNRQRNNYNSLLEISTILATHIYIYCRSMHI
jgi:hypothetical protein